jgi:2'-5' RNA ligase
MDKLRLFIAIPLPEMLLERLADLQHRLKGRVPHRSVRWVRPTGIHLTLKFLGDTPKSKVPTIQEALMVIARNAPTFGLSAEGLGCFPHPGRPRVLWVGVEEPTSRLKTLQEAVEEAMTGLGYKPERHSFTPHLTLGRVRRGVSRQDEAQIGDLVTDMTVEPLASFEADRFDLIQSELKPGGAEYTTLETFLLGGDEGR